MAPRRVVAAAAAAGIERRVRKWGERNLCADVCIVVGFTCKLMPLESQEKRERGLVGLSCFPIRLFLLVSRCWKMSKSQEKMVKVP
jgi:hypothetical protein